MASVTPEEDIAPVEYQDQALKGTNEVGIDITEVDVRVQDTKKGNEGTCI